MEAGILERMLRELPGVLDCSVSDEGVALVVHPEVDPRMIELRAKALQAEAGDTKPLLVVGGMATGPAVAPRAPRRSRGRVGRSPLSATGVVLLVLALLFVVPVAGRDSSSDGPKAPIEPAALPGPVARLPVTEEPAAVAAAPAPVVELPELELVAAVQNEVAAPVDTSPASFAVASAPVAEVERHGHGKLKVHQRHADRVKASKDPRQRQTSGKPLGRKATGLQER